MLFNRENDALKEIKRAVELDPVSLRFNAGWGKILFFQRQYDRAIEQFQKTLELDTNYPLAHERLGYAYEKKGMLREAIAEWSKALALTGQDASILGGAYASSGFEGAVRALAQRQIDRLNEKVAHGQYIAAEEFVIAYMRLGDKEPAFAWLLKAVEERNRFAFEVRIDPVFDPLRRDPRFEKIVASVAPKAN
jgi:tetratricopeptide (TPR) repeat protein